MKLWFRRGAAICCAVCVAAGMIWLERRSVVPVFSGRGEPAQMLVIDAGHGGEDGGAVSANGTVESHINLAIAKRMSAILNLYGVRHVLLREEDRSLHDEDAQTLREKKVSDLHNRVRQIEQTEHAVCVSIHQNIYQNARYHGAHVFYGLNPESLSFAEHTQEVLRTALDPDNERVPAQIPSSVYLMNHITCPAILVECGFLSNPEEDALLRTEVYQTKLALCLASAYLTQEMT